MISTWVMSKALPFVEIRDDERLLTTPDLNI